MQRKIFEISSQFSFALLLPDKTNNNIDGLALLKMDDTIVIPPFTSFSLYLIQIPNKIILMVQEKDRIYFLNQNLEKIGHDYPNQNLHFVEFHRFNSVSVKPSYLQGLKLYDFTSNEDRNISIGLGNKPVLLNKSKLSKMEP